MSNLCPKCHEQAMDAVGKLLRRPFACRHCGQELRMNAVYTLVLSALYLFAVVRIFLSGGAGAQSMAFVLLATVAFIAACLYVPLEEKKAGTGNL